MEWDSDKARDYFYTKYRSQNPEQFDSKPRNEVYLSFQDRALALKDLYIQCFRSVSTKESLIAFLQNTSTNLEISNPKANSKSYYTECYKNEA